MDDDRLLDDDDDFTCGEAMCRHWQSRGVCCETCSCGHGCSEHHEAGWCARCTCLAWVDGPERVMPPAPAASDEWVWADAFDDEPAFDEAAGW